MRTRAPVDASLAYLECSESLPILFNDDVHVSEADSDLGVELQCNLVCHCGNVPVAEPEVNPLSGRPVRRVRDGDDDDDLAKHGQPPTEPGRTSGQKAAWRAPALARGSSAEEGALGKGASP